MQYCNTQNHHDLASQAASSSFPVQQLCNMPKPGKLLYNNSIITQVLHRANGKKKAANLGGAWIVGEGSKHGLLNRGAGGGGWRDDKDRHSKAASLLYAI